MQRIIIMMIIIITIITIIIIIIIIIKKMGNIFLIKISFYIVFDKSYMGRKF